MICKIVANKRNETKELMLNNLQNKERGLIKNNCDERS